MKASSPRPTPMQVRRYSSNPPYRVIVSSREPLNLSIQIPLLGKLIQMIYQQILSLTLSHLPIGMEDPGDADGEDCDEEEDDEEFLESGCSRGAPYDDMGQLPRREDEMEGDDEYTAGEDDEDRWMTLPLTYLSTYLPP